MTLSTALFIFAAQLLAYLVKGLIGFGNPLISAPILSMGLDNVVITPGTLLLDCPVNAWITWKNRHSFQWRKILPLLAANFCGVIPGTLLLRFSMPWVIKTVLGVVVVLLGLEMATRSLRPVKPDRKDRPWLRLAVSAFSGVCAGLFGINMFIVAYLQRTARDYSEFKGSMCFLFFGENAVRVVTYLVTDLFTGPVLLFALASVPAAVLAMGPGGVAGAPAGRGKAPKGRHRPLPPGRRQHHREVRGIPYISSGKETPCGRLFISAFVSPQCTPAPGRWRRSPPRRSSGSSRSPLSGWCPPRSSSRWAHT